MRTTEAKVGDSWEGVKSGFQFHTLDGVEFGFVYYTPELVSKVLDDRNERNRALRKGKIASYTRDMAGDNWMVNGESVVFDDNGNLIDGQHRLTAVAESGRPQFLMTVWGIPAASQSTFDTGAARLTRDTYYMDGMSKSESNHLASTVARIITIERNPKFNMSKAGEVTHAENRQFTAANEDVLEAAKVAARVAQLRLPFSPSGAGAAYFYCARVDKLKAQEFFAQLVEGTMLIPGQPVKALRDRFDNIDRIHDRKSNSAETFANIIWAWNATRKDQKMDRFVGPKNGFDEWPMPR